LLELGLWAQLYMCPQKKTKWLIDFDAGLRPCI